MEKCSQCHNNYDKCFTITMNGKTYSFDSFECAINKLAPICHGCQCKIIGHGVENLNNFYCSAHCAKASGIAEAKDRV